MTITHSPPLAPMTATVRLATLVVENCLARVDTGAWNLENMVTVIRRGEMSGMADTESGTEAAALRSREKWLKIQFHNLTRSWHAATLAHHCTAAESSSVKFIFVDCQNKTRVIIRKLKEKYEYFIF